MPITVALDRCADDARPYVERAQPTHPSLIDSEHVVAHRYAMINVPTVLFIDEGGRIVRPSALEYGTDTFVQFTGKESAPFLAAVRAWVTEGRVETDEGVPAAMVPPTADEERARAEFALAWHLHQAGRVEAAEPHFVRAGELSPDDWTIRRGSMPIRGQDPMGPKFFELYQDWEKRGRPAYASLAKLRL